jgi:hypothetical protein
MHVYHELSSQFGFYDCEVLYKLGSLAQYFNALKHLQT